MARLAVFLALSTLAAGPAIANAVRLSVDGKEHRPVTWVVSYLTACVLVAAVVSFTLALSRKRGESDAKGGAMSDEGKQRPNVTSYHQSGGITAGEVNISAPQPAVKGQVVFTNQQTENGDYQTQGVLTLDASHAAKGLRVGVAGTSVKDLQVNPNLPAAMVSLSSQDQFPTAAIRVIHPPLAHEYIVTVLTEQPDDLKIEALLDT